MIEPLINKIAATKTIKKYMHNTNAASRVRVHLEDVPTGNLGFGWVHYGYIRALRPEHALCVGSAWGYIPFIMAEAIKHNGAGELDFVDAGYDRKKEKDKAWGGMGFWRGNIPPDWWEGRPLNLHICTIEDYCRNNQDKHWKYIYVDGDHSYEGTRSAVDLLLPSLDSDGCLALHDINIQHVNRCKGIKGGPNRVLAELMEQGYLTTIIKEPPGLAIVQKRS